MEGNKKTKTLLVIAVGALLLLNIILGVKLWKGSQQAKEQEDTIETISSEKVELEGMLASTEAELGNLKTDNAQMTEELEQQRLLLEEKASKIKKLLSRPNITRGQLARLKAEINDLKLNVTRLTQTNDSLKVVNEQLFTEKEEFKHNLEVKVDEYNVLSEEKNKIEKIGSKLKARGLRINAIKIKGSGKEVETSRASRADALKITYTIDENELATAGTKEVFIKIIDPQLNTMIEKSSTSGTFVVDGKSNVFTLKERVSYNKEATTQSVIWKKGSDFEKGNYAIELYSEGNFIGGGKFSLR